MCDRALPCSTVCHCFAIFDGILFYCPCLAASRLASIAHSRLFHLSDSCERVELCRRWQKAPNWSVLLIFLLSVLLKRENVSQNCLLSWKWLAEYSKMGNFPCSLPLKLFQSLTHKNISLSKFHNFPSDFSPIRSCGDFVQCVSLLHHHHCHPRHGQCIGARQSTRAGEIYEIVQRKGLIREGGGGGEWERPNKSVLASVHHSYFIKQRTNNDKI